MGRARPSHPGSPLRGRYLVQHPLLRAWLTVRDSWLESFHRSPATDATQLRRILVCVGGHLGDAVIASAAISQIRHAVPSADIGVLSGGWNRDVLSGLPGVRWFHAVDHWRVNRKTAAFPRRWLQYRQSRASAIDEIRRLGYDAAIDLYAYYPNNASVLRAAGIPVRIGYATGGLGAHYTRRVDWKPGRRITEEHHALLETLVPGASRTHCAYDLGALSPAVLGRVDERLRDLAVEPRQFAVVHPGAGMPTKEWPIDHWIAVAREVARANLRVVVTGLGAADAARARTIAEAVNGAVNLCNQLSWPEFRGVIARAAIVLSVDTVAMHIAAAEKTPCVAVMSGIESPDRWVPPGPHACALTHDVPCAPCYLGRGCDEMACVRNVEPARMLEAVRPLLPQAVR